MRVFYCSESEGTSVVDSDGLVFVHEMVEDARVSAIRNFALYLALTHSLHSRMDIIGLAEAYIGDNF